MIAAKSNESRGRRRMEMKEGAGTYPRLFDTEICPACRVEIFVRIEPTVEEARIGLRKDDGIAETYLIVNDRSRKDRRLSLRA